MAKRNGDTIELTVDFFGLRQIKSMIVLNIKDAESIADQVFSELHPKNLDRESVRDRAHLALAEAVETYNHYHGATFDNYAATIVRKSVIEFIKEQNTAAETAALPETQLRF